MQLSLALGCRVIATTHRESKLPLLQMATEAMLDNGNFAEKSVCAGKVLDLVDPRYLRDSLRCATPGGVVCPTGILGGVFTLDNFDPIKEIPNNVYLTVFFSNYPTQAVIENLFSF